MHIKEVTMKTCSVCNATKDLHEFDKRRNTKGEQVATARCKACRREYMNPYNRKKSSKTGLSREDYLNSVRKPKLSSKQKEALAKQKWDAWYREELERMERRRSELLAKGVKTCSFCDEVKPLSQFSTRKRKRKDGSIYSSFYSECKTCRSSKAVKQRASLEGQAAIKAYRKSPAGKARAKRGRALYKKRNKQATPKWLTPEQRKQIVDIYEHMRDCRVVTGEDYHVDHIVPLRGENVCGLHVPWNLQVLPACVNMSKSNQIEDPLRTT